MTEEIQVVSLGLDSLESLSKVPRRPDLNTPSVYSENVFHSVTRP